MLLYICLMCSSFLRKEWGDAGFGRSNLKMTVFPVGGSLCWVLLIASFFFREKVRDWIGASENLVRHLDGVA